MEHRTTAFAAVLISVSFFLLPPRVVATQVWSPNTGDVDLDKTRGDDPEAQFKHAAALLASGEPKSAAKELEGLIRQFPDASWNERARYLLGMARFNTGQYEQAFSAWQAIHEQYPQSKRRDNVFDLQKKAANHIAQKNIKDAIPLYDQMVEIAPTPSMGAQAQKAKADALLQQGDYLHAADQYLALVDYFPDSTLVPYAWYKIGVCHLEMAQWIGRGTDQLELAIRRFEDFLENFPDNELAPKAKNKLEEARILRSMKYERIARYYLGPGQRPTAAFPYFQYMSQTLPDHEFGKRAKKEISEIAEERTTPPRGRIRPMDLPGVTTTNNLQKDTSQ